MDARSARRRNDLLLAAARGEASVEAAMAALAESAGGLAAGITFWRGSSFLGQSWWGLPTDFERDYVAHFSAADPWARAGLGQPPRTLFTSDTLLPRRQLERSAFFNELCRPYRVRDLCGGVLVREGDLTVSFGMLRPDDAKGLGEDECMTLTPSLPILACIARFELDRRCSAAADVAADANAIAVLAVDSVSTCVVTMNVAAEHLVDVGIVRLGERETTVDGEPLTALLGNARPTTRATVRATTAAHGISVVAHPARAVGERLVRAVYIHHAPSIARERARRAAVVFALSPREAEVVEHLMLGASPKEIAARHGVAVSTLRTQIRMIYEKVGVDRQATLIALLCEL